MKIAYLWIGHNLVYKDERGKIVRDVVRFVENQTKPSLEGCLTFVSVEDEHSPNFRQVHSVRPADVISCEPTQIKRVEFLGTEDLKIGELILHKNQWLNLLEEDPEKAVKF